MSSESVLGDGIGNIGFRYDLCFPWDGWRVRYRVVQMREFGKDHHGKYEPTRYNKEADAV